MDRKDFLKSIALASVGALVIRNAHTSPPIEISCEKGVDVLIMDPRKPSIFKVGSEDRPASPADITDIAEHIRFIREDMDERGIALAPFELRCDNSFLPNWGEQRPKKAMIPVIQDRIIIVRLGTEEVPAIAEDIFGAQKFLENQDGNLTCLITHHNLRLEQ